jgi:Immunity protein 40
MNQQELLDLLDAELRGQAVDLEPFGVREYAFPMRLAQRVLDEIVRGGGVVLGGDLWIVHDDGSCRPGHDNWFADLVPGESTAEFSARQARAASAFFERHQNEDRSYATFVLASGT